MQQAELQSQVPFRSSIFLSHTPIRSNSTKIYILQSGTYWTQHSVLRCLNLMHATFRNRRNRQSQVTSKSIVPFLLFTTSICLLLYATQQKQIQYVQMLTNRYCTYRGPIRLGLNNSSVNRACVNQYRFPSLSSTKPSLSRGLTITVLHPNTKQKKQNNTRKH